MGLDIYVRWGSENSETGEWEGFPEEARQDQLTGYEDAPESGYLRHNWSSVSFCKSFPEKVDAPGPLDFFRDWEGYNGEELPVTEDVMNLLKEHRNKIKAWLREGSRETWDRSREMQEQDRKEFVDDLKYFETVLRNTAGFINFVELNKDKPGLTIIFG